MMMLLKSLAGSHLWTVFAALETSFIGTVLQLPQEQILAAAVPVGILAGLLGLGWTPLKTLLLRARQS